MVSSTGGFVTVNGYEELAQRIAMKLTARRGGFALLPEFGSRLYLLGNTKVSERVTAARQYVAEALSDEENLVLEQISVSEITEGTIRIDTEFTYEGDRLYVTTTI
ncbi:MAG: hypothetical protein ACOX7K_10005 [Oscillospiraceae bacterium]